jgi:hypothetical protein
MIGLILTIIIFNLIAFKTNKRLTSNQIVHIWAFTIAFQTLFDIFVEFKYGGYWYFSKDIDFGGLIAHIAVVPPVNMMFLNWYPFRTSFKRQSFYIFIWVLMILLYELVTLLPEPWGYFNYGWWRIWHAAIINPFLLFILLSYYKWIYKLESRVVENKTRRCI